MLDFWWWEFSLSHLHTWRFETYFFIIAFASLFYFLCALLFPSDLREYDGYRDYFMSRRKWFFGLLASTYVVDVLDTLIKGRAHLDAQGYEYPLRAMAYVTLCAAAARTANGRFHMAFAVLALTYQVSWILRRHAVMGL